jgi:hypothetical protein
MYSVLIPTWCSDWAADGWVPVGWYGSAGHALRSWQRRFCVSWRVGLPLVASEGGAT